MVSVPDSTLQGVFRANIVAKVTSVRQRGPVHALRLIAHGLIRFSDAVHDKMYAPMTCRQADEMFDDAGEAFLRRFISNPEHV